MESVEPTRNGDQLRPLFLKSAPDRRIGYLRVLVGFGVRDALVDEPGVQFVIALRSQPGCEEALPHQADLVLNLALLPARRRRAGCRFDEIVPAHLQEPAIVGPVLADKHGLDCGLHVVVDAALARTFEEGKGAIVRVEHHLLRLARISANKHHPAVA